MKLIFAVLDVSLKMSLTNCYKTKSFLIFITCKVHRSCVHDTYNKALYKFAFFTFTLHVKLQKLISSTQGL